MSGTGGGGTLDRRILKWMQWMYLHDDWKFVHAFLSVGREFIIRWEKLISCYFYTRQSHINRNVFQQYIHVKWFFNFLSMATWDIIGHPW